jgi:hypothetical protein
VNKRDYKRSGETKMELVEKISKKIEGVIRAWHRACYRGNILALWRTGGFIYTFQAGTLVGVAINPTPMTKKIVF